MTCRVIASSCLAHLKNTTPIAANIQRLPGTHMRSPPSCWSSNGESPQVRGAAEYHGYNTVPAKVTRAAFPVAPGGAMPPVEGCTKQDYAVLIVIGVDVQN